MSPTGDYFADREEIWTPSLVCDGEHNRETIVEVTATCLAIQIGGKNNNLKSRLRYTTDKRRRHYFRCFICHMGDNINWNPRLCCSCGPRV